MSQSSYFKSRPDLDIDIGGSWRGKSWKNTWSGGIGMKLGG